MKRINLALSALLVVLILGTGVKSAMAYFTTYATAKGGYPITLGDETEISERFSGWTKRVTITADADSQPVYVRARAYCGSAYTLTYSGDGWTLGADGYYYCNTVINGGESTPELLVQIGGIPEDAEDGDSFNVVVVYETTPVQYQADGTPYADWNVLLDTGTEGGGN